ncbi:B-cell receptor CD22-like isoform X3 [Hemibagrus wyckioides]|uniref:B-cell receptor CD22-like isoform X3 n=1 Tax=Hemibagrus wyckioides TaxID=337641 RepID=UPI00266BA121|nr:B-cell receptor CD22-like isoform X3 [Hemibagrus wyckioides]
MMSLKTSSLLCLIFLLRITAALGTEWSVKYSQRNLCALKGSTVFMNGTYTHPTRLTVKGFWLINPVKGIEPTDLCNEPGYSGRVQYLTDGQNHFSLRLSDVKKTDEHMYCFRIRTDTEKDKYTGYPGVTLNVTDHLDVQITPAEVTEGQSAVLTCKTTCSLTDPTFIWYKNSHHLTTKTSKRNEVRLQSVSSEDAGSYSCAVRGYEHHSPAQTLRVRYPPKNVSVSISPSGEIVEGSLVTLTCSSDANPPVKTYTWYKQATSVGTEKTYTISNISSEDTGEYKCRCSNEIGHQESNSVSLNVLYPPKNVSVSISPSGEIVEGSSVTLTCSSDANPPVKTYTWFKGNSSIRTGNTYRINRIRSEDSGDYTCRAENKHGDQSSTAVSLNVLYPPKNVSVSISPSGEIVEGSSVTLTCSSDANPPVQNYTWYKVNESSPVGSGQSYRAVPSGQYYCEAQNKHGSERSAAVTVTLKGSQSVGVYAGLGVVLFVCICLTVTFLCIRRKKITGSRADQSLKQDNLYANIANPTNTVSDSASAHQDEVLYASVVHQRAVDPRKAESSAVKASASEDGEVQYASVRFKRTTTADYRPSNVEDPTVIYSRVK